MANEYLMKEYELCFEQLRFYDTRHDSILKYLLSLTSAVATAQFAIYKLLHGLTVNFFLCQAFLSFIVFIATILLYIALLQNRLYFVYVARQLNAIRGFLMQTEASNFNNNQLYTATDVSAIKPASVHSLQLLGATLLSSLFAGVTYFAMYAALWEEKKYCIAVIVTIVVALIEIGGGIKYLKKSDTMSADEIIHGNSGKETEQ